MQGQEIKAKQFFKGRQTAGVLGKQHGNTHTTDTKTHILKQKPQWASRSNQARGHCPGHPCCSWTTGATSCCHLEPCTWAASADTQNLSCGSGCSHQNFPSFLIPISHHQRTGESSALQSSGSELGDGRGDWTLGCARLREDGDPAQPHLVQWLRLQGPSLALGITEWGRAIITLLLLEECSLL